jgi:hypothetical protein
MEYYSAIKKKYDICRKMDGTGNQSKSDSKR